MGGRLGLTAATRQAARPGRDGWGPRLGAVTPGFTARPAQAALPGQNPRGRLAQLTLLQPEAERGCPLQRGWGAAVAPHSRNPAKGTGERCSPGGEGASDGRPRERTVPRGSAFPLPRRKVSRRSGAGGSPPAAPPTVRRSGAVPVPGPVPARRIPPGGSGGTEPGAALGGQGGSQSSLRPFIPASPKRIRFDVQPGFLWVWSEPVQPSLGDTLLSKSYIFYITSFPAWLFFPLPPVTGEHHPPPQLPHQLKSQETPPWPPLVAWRLRSDTHGPPQPAPRERGLCLPRPPASSSSTASCLCPWKAAVPSPPLFWRLHRSAPLSPTAGSPSCRVCPCPRPSLCPEQMPPAPWDPPMPPALSQVMLQAGTALSLSQVPTPPLPEPNLGCTQGREQRGSFHPVSPSDSLPAPSKGPVQMEA